LNNSVLNNQWVIEKTRWEIWNFLESKENVNTPYENLCGTANPFLRGNYIAMSVYIKNPTFVPDAGGSHL
jgi:hypothetical protein